MNKKTIGNDGEDFAVRFLQNSGYKIIDTNVRPFAGMRRGEIDIIAWENDVFCIIEVKTRSSSRFDANDAITIAKRRQLTRLAQAYVNNHNLQNTECRFDVICIYNRIDGREPEFVLTRHAFDPVH